MKGEKSLPSHAFGLHSKAIDETPSIALEIKQLKAFSARIIRYQESGSPCLKHLEIWKKPVGVQFTKTEKASHRDTESD